MSLFRRSKMEKGGRIMSIEIISIVFNFLLAGGGIVMLVTLKSTKRKAKAEARRTELDNEEKASDVMMTYIVKPLKNEINALRKDVRNLQKALARASECAHYDACPVRDELQNGKNKIDCGED